MKYLLALATTIALAMMSAVAQTSQTAPQGPQTVNVQNGMLPSGTQLSIRTDQDITADSQSVGQTYQAEIANDVVDQNGRVVIPKGSPARLTIANLSSGTMGVGNNQVALALQSVTVNGRDLNLQSDTQTASGNRGIGANKRTGEYVGGGAVLGTVIGAVAGGAKGAILGAVLGGAAGGTAQVLTRGKEVKVPAESVLTFKLDQPVSLNGYSQNSYPSSYPNSQPYPNSQQYPNSQYPNSQQYPSSTYPNSNYPNSNYPNSNSPSNSNPPQPYYNGSSSSQPNSSYPSTQPQQSTTPPPPPKR